MPLARSTVTFESRTGLPEDRIVNSFHFGTSGGAVTGDDHDEIVANLNEFYNGDPAGTPTPMSGYFSSNLSRTVNPVVETYQVDPVTGLSGSPLFVGALSNLQANASQPLPSEVALCVTWKADYEAVVERVPLPPEGPAGDLRPRARRRGRTYLGPWSVDALGTGANNVPTINSFLHETVQDRAAVFLGPIWDGSGVVPVIYSRVNQSYLEIAEGWVDNAWDTQRRRGIDSTARLTFIATHA